MHLAERQYRGPCVALFITPESEGIQVDKPNRKSHGKQDTEENKSPSRCPLGLINSVSCPRL